MIQIKIKKINGGTAPVYKTDGASCADCYANEDKWVWLKPCLVPLGFAAELPSGYEMQIRPRSGMSKKAHHVCLGTVDSDYRGEVKACIWSLFPYHILKGERVCQMYVGTSEPVSMTFASELSETERGANGFGSTGV